jgi:hypothetical protein
VQGVDVLRELAALFACELVAKVRSGFDELGHHDRSTADAVDDATASTASGRKDELVPRVAKLSSGLVVRPDVPLTVAADADPPRSGSIAPAIAAGRNERRRRQRGVELVREKPRERSDIDRWIGQKHRSMLGRSDDEELEEPPDSEA